MKSLKIAVASLFVLALFSGATSVFGQSARLVAAEIPFDFIVNEKMLPRGDYDITITSNGLVRIQQSDGRAAAAVFTMPLRDGAPVGDASGQLVFERVDGQYCLAQVWGPEMYSGGREMLKSRSREDGSADAGALTAVNFKAVSRS
jgi:hypothetical protein